MQYSEKGKIKGGHLLDMELCTKQLMIEYRWFNSHLVFADTRNNAIVFDGVKTEQPLQLTQRASAPNCLY